MKISYNEACARDCSTLRQDLELCEKAGFDFIEIRLDMLRKYLETGTAEELRAFFDKSHLKPHAFNAVYLQPNLLQEGEPDEENQAMKDFFLACETGRIIGSHEIIIVPPLDPSGIFTGDVETAEEDCVRMLKKLSSLARPYGMKLCFELVGLRKSCVRSIEAADRIIRSVNEDNVGFVFDSYNIYLNGQCNQFDAIKKVDCHKIFAVHMMSADDVPEEEMGQDKRCFAGTGIVDTDGFLQTLKSCGYEGMISVETFRPQYWAQSPEWVVEQAYQTTFEALKKNGCLETEKEGS